MSAISQDGTSTCFNQQLQRFPVSCEAAENSNLLFIEDAGLLQGVLALSYVPHSDRPVVAAGRQQAFLTAPTTCDDLDFRLNISHCANVAVSYDSGTRKQAYPTLMGL